LVATACPGTDFYVEHGQTGVLVPPFDVAALRAAIEPLWQDAPLREAQAARARAFARDHLSDEAAAAALHRLIAELG